MDIGRVFGPQHIDNAPNSAREPLRSFSQRLHRLCPREIHFEQQVWHDRPEAATLGSRDTIRGNESHIGCTHGVGVIADHESSFGRIDAT